MSISSGREPKRVVGDYLPPRNNVLVVTCMDQRLIDDLAAGDFPVDDLLFALGEDFDRQQLAQRLNAIEDTRGRSAGDRDFFRPDAQPIGFRARGTQALVNPQSDGGPLRFRIAAHNMNAEVDSRGRTKHGGKVFRKYQLPGRLLT